MKNEREHLIYSWEIKRRTDVEGKIWWIRSIYSQMSGVRENIGGTFQAKGIKSHKLEKEC